ncbi:MAG TPA: M28 family peptidase [Chitinophagaceae bacterium]|nr:M28 family peptidase [Chitinophagaceae bacterium]
MKPTFLRTALMPAVLCAGLLSHGQKLKKADKAAIKQIEAHITYLADDKLEGRRAGTRGEQLASEYISKQFAAAGLQPKGDNNGWLQAFDINDGKEVKPSSHFIINGNDLKLATDYFPLAFSPNGSLEAMPAVALPEQGMPWFVDLKDWLEENKDNPHFDLEARIKQKAADIKAKGASALVIYNTSSIDDKLSFNPKDRSALSDVIVLHLSKDAAKKFLSDASASLDVKIRVEIGEKKRTGNNVVGYIDNGAPTTVILGAHYDHLGYGEDGNSMLRNNTRQIHNGADDNASGIAALIELAGMLKKSRLTANNYLFIAFSGEELGLYGSKHFTENPTVNISTANYMINMDMVGRLNDSSKVLTVGGIGTSPTWVSTLSSIPHKYFTIKYDSSGTGPSDHTSFYRKDIPVLFFFTGLHMDYHRPTDDADKINYTGALMIIRYIYSIIEKNNRPSAKLAFTKTREAQTTTSARFSVSMGIMPDYTFSGAGVRVDGVSEGRPAQKAGLKTGDIVIQLGEHAVSSMETYMQALGKFKKGDIAKVKYKRGNETLETTVQF